MTGTGERPRGARIAVSTYFLLLGITSAVWVARIPAVKERLALSDGQLGIALLAVPVGLMLGTQAAGHLVDRFGSGRVTRVTRVTRVAGVASCLLLLAPGIAGNMAGLMAALLGTGIAGGALDVAMNSHGVRVETAYRRPVMASLHACYSLGGFAGALFGGAFAWAGIGPEPAFVAAGLPAPAGSSWRWGSSGCAAWSGRGRPATGAPSICTTTWARRPAWPPSGTACSRS